MISSLSICIPVFNWDITLLTQSLIDMCSSANQEFEILLYDDGSEESYKEKNRVLLNTPKVLYKELPHNVGRSKIRNLLSKEANYNYLLFLDCDVLPANNNFITLYNQQISSNKKIVLGGLSHQDSPPENANLRWLYGTKKEEVSAETRNLSPHKSFKTSNFLIHKSILLQVQFNEKLKGYGHEDTFFGYDLKKLNLPVYHIDNPVIHLGLESSQQFILKTEDGLKKLASIYIEMKNHSDFIEDIKILQFIKENKATTTLLYNKWKVLKAFYIKNLLSPTPSLRFFDFYKLGFLMNEIKKLNQTH